MLDLCIYQCYLPIIINLRGTNFLAWLYMIQNPLWYETCGLLPGIAILTTWDWWWHRQAAQSVAAWSTTTRLRPRPGSSAATVSSHPTSRRAAAANPRQPVVQTKKYLNIARHKFPLHLTAVKIQNKLFQSYRKLSQSYPVKSKVI